jgi:hypothetical protein
MDLLTELPAIRQRVAEGADRLGDEAGFQAVYQRLGALGLPLRPYEPAWAELRRLRGAYAPHLLAATELLLVARELRGRNGS